MNGAFHYTFQRTEKKYLLTQPVFEQFLERIDPYVRPDEYGQSTVLNIYYDTEHYDLIARSIDGPAYKEKLRLRSYGVPGPKDTVFLELKKKYRGTVFKRRIFLPLEEAEGYLEEGILPRERSQIFREIDYFCKFYHPQPRLFLAYDRVALVGREDGDVRLTFDRNIRSRTDHLHLGEGDQGRTYLREDYRLMELKVPDAFPLWLVRALSELKIYPTSFSKYGAIYREELAPAALAVGRQRPVWSQADSTQREDTPCLQVC